MKPKKSKSSQNGAEDELSRLIEAQRQDADGRGGLSDDARVDDPVVTNEGAIHSRHNALRDLFSPAPDEILTTAPDDDAGQGRDVALTAPQLDSAAQAPRHRRPTAPRRGNAPR